MTDGRILICSDSPVFGRAMRRVLGDLEVATTGIPPDHAGKADLIVWHQTQGELNVSVSTLAQEVPTVVVAESSQLLPAVELGCRGFVDLEADLDEILHAVKTVADGQAYVSASLLGSLLRHMVSRRRDSTLTLEDLAELTPREKEVFELAAIGRRRHDIASELFISSETVRTHLQSVYRKLGVHTQAELVALAGSKRQDQPGDES